MNLYTLFLCVMYCSFVQSGVIKKRAYDIWPKGVASVCWLDDMSDIEYYFEDRQKRLNQITPFLRKWKIEDKLIVRNTVQKNFKLETVGMSFVGWHSCDSGPADIVLIMGKANRRQTIKDMRWAGLKGFSTVFYDKRPVIYIKKFKEIKGLPMSSLELLKLISLHEFSHAAGIDHEFFTAKRHLDSNNKKVCMSGRENWSIEPLKDDQLRVTDYDQNSVMNKCYTSALHKRFGTESRDIDSESGFHINDRSLVEKVDSIFAKVKIQLSLGDIHTLKCIRVFNESERSRLCNDKIKPWLISK